MKQRRRIYYSAAQRSEIWDRWQAGEPMSSIGRRFDRESSSVFSVISPTGGIRPPARRRAREALSLFEREEISRGLSTQCSLRLIARQLGDLRRPSAVKSVAMVDRIGIGLPDRIKPPGIGRCVPSFASWLAVRS
jgi:transposase, IS30 family